MTRSLIFSSFLGTTLLLGCGKDEPNEDTGVTTPPGSTPATGDTTGVSATSDSNPTTSADDSTTGGQTTPPDGTGNTTAESTTSDETAAGTTCGFLCPTTGGEDVGGPQCDVFAQDCPEGEKCSAFAEGGGTSWNATKCVPVTGEGTPGDVCTTEGGGVSGLDDCAKGAFCWDVDDENKGLCVELCTGTKDAPVCSDEAAFNCAVVNEGVLNLCLPNCDPLVQDCAGDDLCIPVGDTFVCVLDASGADAGKQFDPCEFANACDKGLLCLNPSAAMECDPNAGGCCMPFCDLSDPDAGTTCDASAKGTSCLSLYAEGMAPPEFENVGVCVLPE